MKLRIPPPIQTLLACLLMYVVDYLYPLNYLQFPVNNLAICFIIILAVFFLVPAVVGFRRSKTTVNPFQPHMASTLVVSGVYKYTRNPMYVGMAGLLLAWCLFLENPMNIVIFWSYISILTKLQIKPEELALTKLFGKEYESYVSSVRRWL